MGNEADPEVPKEGFRNKKSKNTSPKNSNKASKVWFSPSEFKLRQTLSSQLPKRPTDIYIFACTEGKDLLDLQQRAIKLLLGKDTVWVHGIGVNIPKCITLVNLLQKELDSLEVESFSRSWELTENWSNLDRSTTHKYNSGLHIKCKLL